MQSANPFAIRWKSPQGKKLKELPRSKGNWYYSEFFSLLDVIIEKHMRPSEFELCDPEDDLKIMTAYLISKSRMAEFESKQREKEQKQKSKSRGLFGRRK